MVNLIFAWVIYFFLHSVFASHWFKKNYIDNRLLYNIFAVVSLMPVLYYTNIPAEKLWKLNPLISYIFLFLNTLAILGFILSFKYYDMMGFLGFKKSDKKKFTISPLHRFVRHPWYFFALLIIWPREMSVYQLTTSVLITGYLIIGSNLEDKKLVIEIGNRYVEYKKVVSGLIPLPWKIWRE